MLKLAKYAAAGAPRYWIVDPRDRWLDAYELTPDGVYRRTRRISDGETARLDLGIATVDVELAALLR